MRTKRITVVQIAKLAGVSHSTVSYVLNNRWRAKQISAKLAAKVKAVAQAHSYRPNRLVHALQSGRTYTLAVMLPILSGEYYPRIAMGIEHEAKRHGYHLLISHSATEEDEIAEIDALLEHRVDGLIVVPRCQRANRENYRCLIAQDIPLVFVDSYYPDLPCPAIVGADNKGMRAATSHLLALGHRRIAYLDASVYMKFAHMQDRRRGFLQAMAEHGIEASDACVAGSAESVAESAAKALQLFPRPTAIVATTDYLAADLLGVLEAKGLRVPDDIAVTGFGDCLERVNLYRAPLTSVRIDLERMGQLAVQRLLREIEKMSHRHDMTHVPATLIVRASSGGARALLSGKKSIEKKGPTE